MIFSNLLRGDQIRLTALTSKDLATVAGWHEDADFLRMVDARPASPQTEGLLTQWLEERHQVTDAFVLAVRGKNSEDLIGVIEFEGILWTHQVSWMSIAIGDRRNWGKGYGYEAMQLALKFAFDELNLYRVQLTVFSYNERAIALYEKLGFQREGVYRQFLQRDGNRYDMYLYGLLRSEWEAIKLY